MKRFISIITLLSGLFPTTQAEETIPVAWYVGAEPMVSEYPQCNPECIANPIEWVSVSYDTTIDWEYEGYFEILHDGEIIAQIPFYNSIGCTVTPCVCGFMGKWDMNPAAMIYLPKGESYQLRIPAGFVYGHNHTPLEEFVGEFHVPDFIECIDFLIDNEKAAPGLCVENAAAIVFEVGAPVELSDNAQAEIYEDGVKVGSRTISIPPRVLFDDYLFEPAPTLVIAFDPEAENGLGGRSMRFGKGHSYEVVVPEGAVHAWLREDIPNAEIRFSFTGGSNVADDLSHVRSVVSEQEPHPVRYFNMQGIEVREPSAPGIYVRHDGTKTGKLINRP